MSFLACIHRTTAFSLPLTGINVEMAGTTSAVSNAGTYASPRGSYTAGGVHSWAITIILGLELAEASLHIKITFTSNLVKILVANSKQLKWLATGILYLACHVFSCSICQCPPSPGAAVGLGQ